MRKKTFQKVERTERTKRKWIVTKREEKIKKENEEKTENKK